MTFSKNADLEMKVFFILLPFSYVLQVLFFTKYAALLLYVPLVFSVLRLANGYFTDRQSAASFGVSPFSLLLILFLVMPVYSAFVELYFSGPTGSLKILLTQLFPAILFLVIKDHVGDSAIRFIISILILASAAIALNELYEFLKNTPTLYELRNYAYIKASVIGSSGVCDDAAIGRWSGTTLRPGGLMDHVHAAPFFIGFGLVGCFVFYLHSASKWCLVPGILCVLGLVSSGMRLPVMATGLTLFLFTLLQGKVVFRTGPVLRRFALFFALSAVSVAALYSLTSERARFWDLYMHPLTTGEFVPSGGAEDIAFAQRDEIVGNIKTNGLLLFLGYGVSSSWAIQEKMVSDDVFALNILGGGGVLGIISFYGVFAAFVYKLLVRIRRVSFEERALFLFPAGILLILFISTLHSGIFLRRSIYPLFFFSGAMAVRYFKGRGGDV